MAADGDQEPRPAADCDDFVYALLGLASTGAAIERMANCVTPPSQNPPHEVTATRFLR